MNDPYKTLGVSRDASDDEIKKAYRALAKKYHPDNYRDTQLSDLAEEKMKEINEAYDIIQKQRQSGSSGQSGSWDKNGGTSSFPQIRIMINEGRFSEADINLDYVPSSMRNAEWHYLKSIILLRRRWVYDALKHIDIACQLDPTNEEYRQLKVNLQNAANGYGRQFTNGQNTTECSGCDICTSLLCADCLCECCGGDIVPCC